MIGFVILLIFYIEIIMAAFPLWLNSNYNLNCQPKKIYRSVYGNCKCTNGGDWPNKHCRSHFQIQEQECKPNEYVLINCNVCRCGPDGKVDKTQCTKHVCSKKGKKNRRSNSDNVCQTGVWYTLSPCRICYCVDKHELICNNNFDSPKVQLGKHDLNICGENLLEDLQELALSKTKSSNYNKMENFQISKKSNNKDDASKKRVSSKRDKNKKHKRDKTYKIENVHDLHDDKTENININIEGEANKPNYESDIFIGTDVKWDDDSKEKEGAEKEETEIKFKIPKVLNEFLNLVMRKSMVTVEAGTECTPGTATKVDCNTCFCLANGNMICTKKHCN